MISDKKETPELKAFGVVFLYCIVILALPVATFFGSKYFIFEGLFSISTIAANVWSAVFAVVALHVALGFFIHKAYSGGEPEVEKVTSKIE